ncbi:MAG: hypothetical protein SGJ24_20035 [Chloroflexota bacterium]|nr:hypothetical protein [Chloroflexota bacterium]
MILSSDEHSPRDRRLTDAARIFGWGALAYVGVALLLAIAALVGAALQVNWIETARGLLLFRGGGGADSAILVTLLLTLVGAALLTVGMIGIDARALWTPPLLIVLVGLALVGLVGLGFTPGAIALIAIALAALRLNGHWRAFRLNPVMMKELRGRMRGIRAFAVLTVYLLAMGAITLILYAIYGALARSSGTASVGEVGRALFYGIAGVELLLILFIAPAFTAGAITSEREHQTYDLLQTTLLSHPTFILGKLQSALSYIALLLLAGIPLQSLAFLFGGISEGEIALSLLILMVTAVLLGAVGIYFSAALPRTLLASARAYGAVMVGLFLAPILIALLLNLFREFAYTRLRLMPPAPVEAIFNYISLLLISINPAAAGLASQVLLVDQGVTALYPVTLRADGSTMPMVSPWIVFTILALGASALLLLLTIRVAARRARDADNPFLSAIAPSNRSQRRKEAAKT